MSNMGYCRFQNTLQDLRDCNLHLNDDNLSDEERAARAWLIQLCCEIADEARDDEQDLDDLPDEIAAEADDDDDD